MSRNELALGLAAAALLVTGGACLFWLGVSGRSGSEAKIVWQGKPVFTPHRTPEEIERRAKGASGP